MTAEQRLRQLTAQLEAAKRIAAEKRKHFLNARALALQPGGYEAYLIAAHQYAAAADTQTDLDEQHEEAMAEAQAEELRRERLQSQYVDDGNLAVDQEMSLRAMNGDEEARQWVYRNLK